MALYAARLGVLLREHRPVPVVLLVPMMLFTPLLELVLHGPVIDADEVQGFPGAAVADRAADIAQGMRRLGGEIQVEVRM